MEKEKQDGRNWLKETLWQELNAAQRKLNTPLNHVMGMVTPTDRRPLALMAVLVVNSLSTNIHIQILQTDLHTSSLTIS